MSLEKSDNSLIYVGLIMMLMMSSPARREGPSRWTQSIKGWLITGRSRFGCQDQNGVILRSDDLLRQLAQRCLRNEFCYLLTHDQKSRFRQGWRNLGEFPGYNFFFTFFPSKGTLTGKNDGGLCGRQWRRQSQFCDAFGVVNLRAILLDSKTYLRATIGGKRTPLD